MNSFQQFFAKTCRRLVGPAILGCAMFHQIAWARPADEPWENFLATDGLVYAIAETNNVLYLGGTFTSVGLLTGGGVPVSVATGAAEATYPKVNGYVNAVVSDGQGGWFVGGAFTRVGGQPRTNLAHIRSNRTVDPGWRPSATDGQVSVLQLAGETLYLGGTFTNVNGQTRNRAAAVDANSGTLVGWNPNADSAVKAIAISGTNVYLGGDFTNVFSQTRRHLASVDATTGQVTAWNPGASGSSGATDFVEAMIISGGRLFVGGRFTTIGGQSRSRLASFDLSTGLVESWNPNVGTVTIVLPVVYALAAHQNTIFVAGCFSQVGASNRVNIAAVDATTGLATSWDAQADYGVVGGLPQAYVAAMTVHSNAVFVGGYLFNIGGQPRQFAAALDVTTGDATPWDPRPNMVALAFSGSSNTVYLGGAFSTLAGLPRVNLAAFDLTTRQITSWNPVTSTNVLALQIAGNRMYIGGGFKTVGGLPRTNLAAVDLATGNVLDWTPNPNAYVYALAAWNNSLYVGGAFTNISGTARTNLAEFDLDTGNLTSWDPALNRALVMALAVHGNTLYAGGFINTVGAQTRRRLAAFDLTTGLLTPWDAGITSTSSLVWAICPLGDRVYVGGRFGSVGGYIRTNFVALDANTAAVLPLVANANSYVYALAATSNQVFVGGYFDKIGDQNRRYLAALDAATGQVTTWNPNPDLFVQQLTCIGDALYTGGAFLQVGGQSGRGIAAFSLLVDEPPVIQTDSLARLGDGRFQFQLTAPGAAQATIWASTNLVGWQNLQAVTVTNGSAQFRDADAPNHRYRFYRVSVP